MKGRPDQKVSREKEEVSPVIKGSTSLQNHYSVKFRQISQYFSAVLRGSTFRVPLASRPIPRQGPDWLSRPSDEVGQGPDVSRGTSSLKRRQGTEKHTGSFGNSSAVEVLRKGTSSWPSWNKPLLFFGESDKRVSRTDTPTRPVQKSIGTKMKNGWHGNRSKVTDYFTRRTVNLSRKRLLIKKNNS